MKPFPDFLLTSLSVQQSEVHAFKDLRLAAAESTTVATAEADRRIRTQKRRIFSDSKAGRVLSFPFHVHIYIYFYFFEKIEIIGFVDF